VMWAPRALAVLTVHTVVVAAFAAPPPTNAGIRPDGADVTLDCELRCVGHIWAIHAHVHVTRKDSLAEHHRHHHAALCH
jgi:hypothetical protein